MVEEELSYQGYIAHHAESQRNVLGHLLCGVDSPVNIIALAPGTLPYSLVMRLERN